MARFPGPQIGVPPLGACRMIRATLVCLAAGSLFLLTPTGRAAAQTRTLLGRIVSTQTEEPVPEVTVAISGVDGVVRTNTRGTFELSGIEDSVITISFTRLGYEPMEYRLRLTGERVVADLGTVGMTPLAQPLEAIEVEGEAGSWQLVRNGFHERARLGLGDFVTRADLDEWNPAVFTDIVRHVSGFIVTPNTNYLRALPVRRSAFGYPVEMSRGIDTRRTVIATRRGRGGCATAIIVDGMRIGTTLDTDIDRYLHPGHVEGIEVYAGPSELPAEFNQLGAPCGAFIIWTR